MVSFRNKEIERTVLYVQYRAVRPINQSFNQSFHHDEELYPSRLLSNHQEYMYGRAC